MHVLTTVLAVGAVSVLALVAAGPRLGLYRIEAVLSGSMEPTFRPGDLIVVTPEPSSDVKVGQVISYQIPIGDHHVESHRIVKVLTHGPRPVIVTKGDNNAIADPWTARLTSKTAWRERFSIPRVGWVIVWLRQPLIQRITVLAIPCLLAAWWLIGIWRRPRRGEA
jgi:signal peptidase I